MPQGKVDSGRPTITVVFAQVVGPWRNDHTRHVFYAHAERDVMRLTCLGGRSRRRKEKAPARVASYRDLLQLLRMDDEHILTLVKAVHRTDLYAVYVLAFDAIVGDDVGHGALLCQGRSSR
jgi:hypothetical protein